MRKVGFSVFIASLMLCATLNLMAKPGLAYEFDPGTNFAQFLGTPYPIGPNNITVNVIHYDTHSSMTIYLYRYDTIVASYSVNKYTRAKIFYYSATCDAKWKLGCYVSGYGEYQTDETRDPLVLTDPYPPQNNLGSDSRRHPYDLQICQKATAIVGNPNDSYCAVVSIKQHIQSHYLYESSYPYGEGRLQYQPDTNMMAYFDANGVYRGNCHGDAVLLTAYARSLGIPARIVELHIHYKEFPEDPGLIDIHAFAEMYVSHNGVLQWITVDALPDNLHYGWLSLTEANQDLTAFYGAGSHIDRTDIGVQINDIWHDGNTYFNYTGEFAYHIG